MNYILMDIKKFLKKLENGQMEIEAGQWELHKGITNVKSSIQELKQLKKDLQQVKLHGLKQTGLIKELQMKLKALEEIQVKNHSLTLSNVSKEYEKIRKKFGLNEPGSKGNKKKKSHIIHSEEILEIMSEESNQKSDSTKKCENKVEKSPSKDIEKRQKEQSHLSEISKGTRSPSDLQKNYSPRNHSILQRYLQDSAKYIERDTSQMSYVSSENQQRRRIQKRKSSGLKKNFQTDKSWKTSTNSMVVNNNQNEAANFEKEKKTTASFGPGKRCSACPKSLTLKSNFLCPEKQDKSNNLFHCKICGKSFFSKYHLKKHVGIHEKSSKCFRGFRCSYCDKICCTPNKLTAHLKNCRIITKLPCREE